MAFPARVPKAAPIRSGAALLLAAGLSLANPASASPESDALKEEVRRLQERIEDLEGQVKPMRDPGKVAQALDGVTAGAALTMVGQRATRGTTDARPESQLSYRADVEVEIPGDTFGRLAGIGDSRLFAHFRAGQGAGLGRLNPTLTGTPNSTGFFLANSDDSAAILAQAWYQLGVPLDPGASGRLPRIELTLGKIDLFGFFDQNEVADDESEGFLNNVFVHNPLLDSGGDIGADSYGFAPGAIVSYTNDVNTVNRWKLSLGAFGAGSGAGFDGSFAKPLVIAQAEYTGRVLRDRPGTYRAYAWSNGRTAPFANEFETAEERHSGWGLSLDQEVARYTSLFLRYGQSSRGQVRFDRAFTIGGQLGGHRWGRGQDRVGLALGWLDPSTEFKTGAPVLDADGDGNPDFGFSPGGAETSVELFYAWQINRTFQLTPSWQRISRPGGDAAAEAISIFSLRAKAAF